MASTIRRLIAVPIAVLAILSLAAAVVAYEGQVAANIMVSGPTSAVCGTPFSVKATVLDTSGAPIAAKTVTWSLVDAAAGDTLHSGSTRTDASGVAQTTATIGCPGHTLTIQAAVDDATGQVMVQASGGLPNTATLPAPNTPAIPLGLALAVLVGLCGGLLLTARRLPSR